jgi:hypothetical protein
LIFASTIFKQLLKIISPKTESTDFRFDLRPSKITINVLVVYMAQYVRILKETCIHYEGHWKGVGPGN